MSTYYDELRAKHSDLPDSLIGRREGEMLAEACARVDALTEELRIERIHRQELRDYMDRLLTPTPATDELRDKYRGDETELCRALISHANQQERALAHARREAEEAKRDSARLDWLDDRLVVVNEVRSTGCSETLVCHVPAGHGLDDKTTIRDRIDAATAAGRKGA
jgi:hypothetical protein